MLRPALVVIALMLPPLPALAQACPAPLAGAHRLVLVTAPDVASTSATLQRFTRASPQAPWKPDGGPVTALVGHNGMGWAHAFRSYAKEGEPDKVDGDKKAPAGFYKIGHSFGFARVVLRYGNIDALAAKLRENGFLAGEVHKAHDAFRVMMLTDPDGYTVEIIEQKG